MNRTKQSIYMEWAKLHSSARFNLATSGIPSVPLADLPVRLADLELTAPGGYGHPPLLERMAEHARVPIDCVVSAAGTSMANHLAMATVLEPGDEVLIEQPAYGPLFELADYFGANVRRFPRRFENGFAIDLDELSRLVRPTTRLIVLSNLHNPTGALIPAETLRQIGNRALDMGAFVLVDEVYLDMLFDPDAPYSFLIGSQLAGHDRNPFIVTTSLTKTYGLSGLRCGWILAQPALARRTWQLNDLFAANAAHPAERLSAIAFDHLEKFRTRAHTRLQTNRPLVDAFLDARPDLECFRPPAGSIVFLRLPSGDSEGFAKLLREKFETSVVPGFFFEMPRHFRIGLAGETSELQGGLERVSAALNEFAGLH